MSVQLPASSFFCHLVMAPVSPDKDSVPVLPLRQIGLLPPDIVPPTVVGFTVMVMVFDGAVVAFKQVPPLMLISQVTAFPLLRPLVV